jgi:hypothetical protein
MKYEIEGINALTKSIYRQRKNKHPQNVTVSRKVKLNCRKSLLEGNEFVS